MLQILGIVIFKKNHLTDPFDLYTGVILLVPLISFERSIIALLYWEYYDRDKVTRFLKFRHIFPVELYLLLSVKISSSFAIIPYDPTRLIIKKML